MRSDRGRAFVYGHSRLSGSTSKALRPNALRASALALILASLATSPASADYIASASGSISAGSASGDNQGSFLLYNQWDPSTCGYALATIYQQASSNYVITEPVSVSDDTLAVNSSLSMNGTLYNGPISPIGSTSSSTTLISYGPVVIQTSPEATITPSFSAQQTATAATVDGPSPNPDVAQTGPVTGSSFAGVSNSAYHQGNGSGIMPPMFFAQAIVGIVDQRIINDNVLVAEFTGSFEVQTTASGSPMVTTTGDLTRSDVTVIEGTLGAVSFTVATNYMLNSTLDTLTSTVQVQTDVYASLETTLSGCPEPSTWVMSVTALIVVVGYSWSRRGRARPVN